MTNASGPAVPAPAAAGPWRGFVILGAARTGVPLLVEILNQCPAVQCHGELFHPRHLGRAGVTSLSGQTLASRDADPVAFLNTLLVASPGQLVGFSLPAGQNQAALSAVLADPSIAKIVLRRRPLDTWLAQRIAQAAAAARRAGKAPAATPAMAAAGAARPSRRPVQVAFDPQAYASYRRRQTRLYRRLDQALSAAGQKGHTLRHGDLGSVEAINDLLAFLRVGPPLTALARTLQPQKPGDVFAKVSNVEVLKAFLRQDAKREGKSKGRKIRVATQMKD